MIQDKVFFTYGLGLVYTFALIIYLYFSIGKSNK